MRSFGRLLRRMRGVTPLSIIAGKTTFDEPFLASLEACRTVADEIVVRHILRKGFDLDQRDTTKVVLGIELYDLGLRDADLRQLVIDLITKEAPAKVRQKARDLYQSYNAQ